MFLLAFYRSFKGHYCHLGFSSLGPFDSRIGSFSVCCMFKSLEGSFEWGLIGVYGPNDDYIRCLI